MDKVGFYKELDKAGIGYKKDFSVKKAANFGIGGPAEAFIETKDMRELKAAVRAAVKARGRYMAVGNMTNILVADGRINRIFIKLAGKFGEIGTRGANTVHAGAAVKNGELLNFMVKHGLGGLEFRRIGYRRV